LQGLSQFLGVSLEQEREGSISMISDATERNRTSSSAVIEELEYTTVDIMRMQV
jgi:hypothetical protein